MATVTSIQGTMAEYIRAQCECDFSTVHITGVNLSCSENLENHVSARIQISVNPALMNISQLIEHWVDSQPLIVVLGEFFMIDNNCQVFINRYDPTNCLEMATSIPSLVSTSTAPENVAVIAGSSSITFLAAIVLLPILIAVAYWKHTKK